MSDPIAASTNIAITPVNDAPIVSAPLSFEIDEGGFKVFTSAELLGNTTDDDPSSLVVQNVVLAGSNNGTLYENANGTWLYMPGTYTGPISISYEVWDGIAAPVPTSASIMVENLINGTSGDDTLPGSIYNDTITGDAGNDTISGDAGDDEIYGNDGDDIINGDAGDDILGGGGGIDTISGNAGADTIIGGDGNDTLSGGTGADRLDGGAGADTMAGDQDDDTYVVDNVGDTVTEIYDGGSGGIDTVESSISYSLGNNVENLTLTGTATDGTGNTLDNTLIGNASDNTLNGGAGVDILDGGAGDDHLTGGTGNDTYLFGLGDEADVINNIGEATSSDKIVFGANIDADQLWFTQDGNDLKVDIIGTNDSLTVDDWFVGSDNTVNQFETTADGGVLNHTNVNLLVSEMASWTSGPPALGETELSTDQHAALDNAIASAWGLSG